MASRREPAEWAVLIDERRASGLALPEFCRSRGLNKATLSGWVYKPALKRAVDAARRGNEAEPTPPRTSLKTATAARNSVSFPAETAPANAFVPVRFTEAAAHAQQPADRGAIEVVVGAGRRVIVGPGFDPETLRRVVDALELKP